MSTTKTLTLTARVPCTVCGHGEPAVMVGRFRILKRGLRALDRSLVLLPRVCQECRTPMVPNRIEQWRIDGDALATDVIEDRDTKEDTHG